MADRRSIWERQLATWLDTMVGGFGKSWGMEFVIRLDSCVRKESLRGSPLQVCDGTLTISV